MAGFNMMDLMNGASKSETTKPSYELREIPIGKLIPNPANAYSMDGIEELANSILIAGRVLQNLVVKPADENGNYMIISGHRRHLASKMLVEQGYNEFSTVSALIENERNETLQELMLIYTNSTARVLTDAEKMRQAMRATELLKGLKEKGQFSERIRDAVAKMLGTTTGQVGRYQAIANNLTNPDLKEKFENGEMGVSAAYEASRLSEKGQQQIADKMKDGQNVSVYDISSKKKDEDEAAGSSQKAEKKNTEGLPMKDTVLRIFPKFKMEITIHTVEKDGKYYASSDVDCKAGDFSGYGSLPLTTRDEPHDTEQQAIEAEIKRIASMKKHYHKALWESGYRIVGEPQREETPSKAVATESGEKTSQTGARAAEEALPEAGGEQEEAAADESDAPEDVGEEEEKERTYLAMAASMNELMEMKEGHIKAAEAVRKHGDETEARNHEAIAAYMQTLVEKIEQDLTALGYEG